VLLFKGIVLKTINIDDLRPAFAWTCDDCGRDNYGNLIAPEMSKEEHEEIVREQYGLNDWESVPEDSGKLLLMPANVECIHCQSCFKTENNHENY